MALKLAEVVSPPKAEEVIGVASNRWSSWIEQLLCALGLHDFRMVESVFGFGAGGQVDKVECRRCGYMETRKSRP